MMAYKKFGVDISQHNGKINFAELKKHVDFVIIRVGYGVMTLNNNEGVDKMFHYNVNECIKHGIPYGFYQASYCYNDERAKLEAEALLKTIKGYKPEYPIYWDYEYFSTDYNKTIGVKDNATMVQRWSKIWCDVIEKASYYAGIYSNIDYINRYFGKDIFKRYDLWVADWRGSMGYPARLWQNTSDGSVGGVGGRVDTNYCYYDYPSVIRKSGLNGFTKEEVKPPKEDKHKLAIGEIKEVLKKYEL